MTNLPFQYPRGLNLNLFLLRFSTAAQSALPAWGTTIVTSSPGFSFKIS